MGKKRHILKPCVIPAVTVDPEPITKCACLTAPNCQACTFSSDAPIGEEITTSLQLIAQCGSATAVMTIQVNAGFVLIQAITASQFTLTLSKDSEVSYSTLFTTSLQADGNCQPCVSGKVDMLSLNNSCLTPSNDSNVSHSSVGSLGLINGEYCDDPNTLPNQSISQDLSIVNNSYAINYSTRTIFQDGVGVVLQACSHAPAILTCDENNNPVSATSYGSIVPTNQVTQV